MDDKVFPSRLNLSMQFYLFFYLNDLLLNNERGQNKPRVACNARMSLCVARLMSHLTVQYARRTSHERTNKNNI